MSVLLEKLQSINLIQPESKVTEARNYQEIGITTADIKELKDIILDFEEEEEEIYHLYTHAWRALYQLAPSSDTLNFLLTCGISPKYIDNDWLGEDLVYIIQNMGEPAIKTVDDFCDITLTQPSRLFMVEGLWHIPKKYPELKEKVVAVLVKHFQNYENYDASANGFLLLGLLQNDAALANIDLIRAAFGAGKVDNFCAGDLKDVEIRLGLRPPRHIEPMLSDLKPRLSYMDNGIEPIKGRILPNISKKEREKRDAKKKLAKKSKKANRKK
jgi:hypothetical protein